MAAIWAVEGALLLGILTVFVFAWRPVLAKFADGSKAAVAGALLASHQYCIGVRFRRGDRLAARFRADRRRAQGDPQSAHQRGHHRDGACRDHRVGFRRHEHRPCRDVRTFIAAAEAAKIPLEVLHRVASMASGGMDTLPHNGAVITLLAVTGLTHREAYKDIFVITLTKTAAVFVVIGFYYLTGIY